MPKFVRGPGQPYADELRRALRMIWGRVQSAEEAIRRNNAPQVLSDVELDVRRVAAAALEAPRDNGQVVNALEQKVGDLESELIDARLKIDELTKKASFNAAQRCDDAAVDSALERAAQIAVRLAEAYSDDIDAGKMARHACATIAREIRRAKENK